MPDKIRSRERVRRNEKSISSERVKYREKTRRWKRATTLEKTKVHVRAKNPEKTMQQEQAIDTEKTNFQERNLVIECPSVQSILLCDVYILDAHTQKHTLVGIFENFMGREFPLKAGCWLYLVVTDGRGQIPFKITMKNLGTNEEAEIVTGCFTMNNPLAGAGIAYPFSPTFKAPGAYVIDVYCQDTHIGSKRFQVLKISDPQNPVI